MIKDMYIYLKRKSINHLRTNDKYRNVELIRELFDKKKNGNDFIDDCTFHDLNLDTIFEKIDFTSTTAGEQVLYKTLREPQYDGTKLLEDEKNYKYIKENDLKRNNLNKILKRIDTNRYSVSDIIDKPIENIKMLKLTYYCGLAFILMCLVLFAVFPSTNTMLLYLASMLINIYLHFSANKKLVGQIETVSYLAKIINSCEEITRITNESPIDPRNRISVLYKNLNHIGKKVTGVSFIKNIPMIGEIISIIFLINELTFFKICNEIIKQSEEVMELYELVGGIDSNLSVVDYRDSLKDFTRPNFTNEKSRYEVVELKHPLIDNPIGNSFIKESNGIVITGSNMSGKSTFLRTVGVNAVLAQTINTVLAQKYYASFFKVISSISLRDDIQAGKSFYRSEAEAIKRVVEDSNGNITVLSLIDEIFKGTNPVERINAACEILRYIANGNVLSIVTTHDIDLLPLIPNYDQYYFTESIKNNKLKFDYQIKDGVSPNGNATKILEMIGYPEVIINNIYKRLEGVS